MQNIARVLDDLQAGVIGLAEIENETVVRDLMYAMKSDYNYIYRSTNDFRGMSLVLLYRGDTFFPHRVRQAGGKGVSREFLVVEGKLSDEPVTLILCHMPSQLNNSARRNTAARSLRQLIDSILKTDPDTKLIVMGDFNTPPSSPAARSIIGIQSLPENRNGNSDGPAHPLYTPFTEQERRGYGTYVYRDRRFVYDYIALSGALLRNSGLKYGNKTEIFVRSYLVHTSGPLSGYPIRSFDKGKYTGGYSDHLPVLLRLEKSGPGRPQTSPENDL